MLNFIVTPIEVLDSAIKIGLGALISGVATYWVTKLNHDRTAEKEQAQRRRVLLETIAEQVGTFNQVALKHWVFVLNQIMYTSQAEQMTEATRAEFIKNQSQLSDSFKELNSVEAKLLLLGEVKCQKLLREYGSYVSVFREQVITNRTRTVEELQKYKKELDTKREMFFTEMSNIYRSVE